MSIIRFGETVIFLCFCCCMSAGYPVEQQTSTYNLTALVVQYPLHQYRDSLLNQTLLPFLKDCDSVNIKNFKDLARCFAFYEMIIELSRVPINDFQKWKDVDAVLRLNDDPSVTNDFCAALKIAMPKNPVHLKPEQNYSEALIDPKKCQFICTEMPTLDTINVQKSCLLISAGYVAIERYRNKNVTAELSRKAAMAKAEETFTLANAAFAGKTEETKSNRTNDQKTSQEQLKTHILKNYQQQQKELQQLKPVAEHLAETEHTPKEQKQPQQISEQNKTLPKDKVTPSPITQQNTLPKVNLTTNLPSSNNLTPQIPSGKADETPVNQPNDLEKVSYIL